MIASTRARKWKNADNDNPTQCDSRTILTQSSHLSPFNPELAAIKAGRLMLEEIREHVHKSNSFAFETRLSGRGYVRMIRDWRDKDYLIKLIFLSLASPEEAIARVTARCAQGGHHIPDEVVRRRFHSGLRKFETVYKHEIDFWRLYDNSGDVPVFIDEGSRK